MSSEDVALNGTLTTPTCQGGCMIGTPLPRSSPSPCNETGGFTGKNTNNGALDATSRIQVLWTRSTHAVSAPTCTCSTLVARLGVRSGVVSPYVSEPTRLRPSFGHGVDWRTGVDVQHTGSFTHRAKLLSCPWGRDPWGTRNISL